MSFSLLKDLPQMIYIKALNTYLSFESESDDSSSLKFGTTKTFTISNLKDTLSLLNLNPLQSAYLAAFFVSLLSFLGVIFVGLLRVKILSGPIEYMSLTFAGTALIADACLHLMPTAYGVHSHGDDHGNHGNGEEHHHHGHEHGHGHEHHSHSHSSESKENPLDTSTVGLLIALGGLSLLLIDTILDTFTESESSESESNSEKESSQKKKKHNHKHNHSNKILSFGLANLVVEALHNFIDGVAIGLAFLSGGVTSGISATIGIALHELPQELGDFLVLRMAGFETKRLLFWNFIVGLTAVLGVGVVGWTWEGGSDGGDGDAGKENKSKSMDLEKWRTGLVAVAAGSFLSLAFNMIFPQVRASVDRTHQNSPPYMKKLAYLACWVSGAAALASVMAVEASHSGAPCCDGHDIYSHGHKHEHVVHGHGHDKHDHSHHNHDHKVTHEHRLHHDHHHSDSGL